jgi:hypothetical protein
MASLILASAQSLPDQLVGTWNGTLMIYKAGVVRDSVAIRLTVTRPTTPGSWPWKTEYLSEKMPMTKDYTLRLSDPVTQTYAMDEGGGVALLEQVFGSKMYSVFETHDTMLTSTYELRGKDLIFEVTSGKKAGTGAEVTNYTVIHLQRAVLRKATGP